MVRSHLSNKCATVFSKKIFWHLDLTTTCPSVIGGIIDHGKSRVWETKVRAGKLNLASPLAKDTDHGWEKKTIIVFWSRRRCDVGKGGVWLSLAITYLLRRRRRGGVLFWQAAAHGRPRSNFMFFLSLLRLFGPLFCSGRTSGARSARCCASRVCYTLHATAAVHIYKTNTREKSLETELTNEPKKKVVTPQHLTCIFLGIRMLVP